MLEVRCYTCNHVVGHLWTPFVRMRTTHTGKERLDELGLTRMCCRRMLLSHVPVVDDLVTFSAIDEALDECGTMLMCETRTERIVPCD